MYKSVCVSVRVSEHACIRVCVQPESHCVVTQVARGEVCGSTHSRTSTCSIRPTGLSQGIGFETVYVTPLGQNVTRKKDILSSVT